MIDDETQWLDLWGGIRTSVSTDGANLSDRTNEENGPNRKMKLFVLPSKFAERSGLEFPRGSLGDRTLSVGNVGRTFWTQKSIEDLGRQR